MSYNLSGCVFIKDCFVGAFCLFESLYQLLPLVDEMIIMDLGSTDGTFEELQGINSNPKIRLYKHEWPFTDANVFATLANDLVAMCQNENVLYFQADEIWHEDLIERMKGEFEQGNFDLAFWRYQTRENFQKIKWYPHPVHRVGKRNNFNFTGDGMNTDRVWDARICSQYGGEYFTKWGKMSNEEIKSYLNDMILDVSLVGGFLGNIKKRRELHAPFWHEEPTIEGINADEWLEAEEKNNNWTESDSPFNIPDIMRDHVGQKEYKLRGWLREKLKEI